MNLECILLAIVILPTIIIYFLQKYLANKSGRFANIVNKIWEEWFEEQWKAILAFVLFLSIAILLGFIFK